MNVTEVERKESTKHCCGNGYCRIDSAEHEGEGRALIDGRITESNTTDADRRGCGMLEAIVSTANLNQAYKRVEKNKGAGGVDGMKVDELLQYLNHELEKRGHKFVRYADDMVIFCGSKASAKQALSNARLERAGFISLSVYYKSVVA